jgi:hypothetical protein
MRLGLGSVLGITMILVALIASAQASANPVVHIETQQGQAVTKKTPVWLVLFVHAGSQEEELHEELVEVHCEFFLPTHILGNDEESIKYKTNAPRLSCFNAQAEEVMRHRDKGAMKGTVKNTGGVELTFAKMELVTNGECVYTLPKTVELQVINFREFLIAGAEHQAALNERRTKRSGCPLELPISLDAYFGESERIGQGIEPFEELLIHYV